MTAWDEVSPDDWAAAKEAQLEGAVEVVSIGLFAEVGAPGGMPRLLLRCPGFDHAGVPEGEADCDYRLALFAGDGEAKAVYVIRWPEHNQERRLLFDLRTTRRRFFAMAEEAEGHIAITGSPQGTIPGDVVALDIAFDDEAWVQTRDLCDAIEAEENRRRA